MIVILGSNGMAGHMISKYLKSKGHSILTVARNNADIEIDFEDKNSVDDMLCTISKLSVQFVINCVGLLVKDSIERPDRAIILNSWLPHYIEYNLSKSKTRIVHLSTDCVFDGQKGSYIETDLHTETNSYGRSKSLGEINNQKDITFRMSIIGPEIKEGGTGLLYWFINKSESSVDGWDNAMWNGITTLQLAKSIEQYINNPCITGIYHLVNNENSISKYELLKKVNNIYKLNKTVNKTNGPKTIDKILVDTRKEFNFKIPNYDIQLTELKEFKF